MRGESGDAASIWKKNIPSFSNIIDFKITPPTTIQPILRNKSIVFQIKSIVHLSEEPMLRSRSCHEFGREDRQIDGLSPRQRPGVHKPVCEAFLWKREQQTWTWALCCSYQAWILWPDLVYNRVSNRPTSVWLQQIIQKGRRKKMNPNLQMR